MHKHSLLYGLIAGTLLLAWVAPSARAQATLRNGDILEIKISGIPSTDITSVSGQYTIDNEGFLNLPYVGKVKVAGLSPGVAQSTIESVYRNRDVYTNPTITIGQQMQSRFVNVGGEVKTPQRIPYTADLTVLSSINAAGGFSPFADQRKVRLLRGNEVMIIDVKKIRANPSLDIGVQPGDRIEVPQTIF
ncbi:MAG: polysaccharide export protein [Verrucomicrobia bacterium]|jgi:protein involved in polysaccharide export with SLBB domain|nr:polysaccharide export protein [Verrucomicrobiota bacterium]